MREIKEEILATSTATLSTADHVNKTYSAIMLTNMTNTNLAKIIRDPVKTSSPGSADAPILI